MTPIFKNESLQREFDLNGFVKVPFLSEEQANQLFGLYKQLEERHKQIGLPFTTTSHSNDENLIRTADSYIAGVFKPEMDKILCDYKLLFGNFLIKEPGMASVTPLHQDTTFVDETKFSSISVWVSLQDTNQQNGCMRFIKGSHKFKFTLRPTHAYPWPFEKVRPQLENLLKDYPSKKGEAFIFHHALAHASYPNLTDAPRVAAVMAAYPADAELLMLYQPEKNSNLIGKYKMTKEAYLHFVKGQPPAMGVLLETLPFSATQFTPDEFEDIINPRKNFIQKFTKRFFAGSRQKAQS